MKKLSSQTETGFLQGIKETISKHPLTVSIPTAVVLLAGGVKSAIADLLCFAPKKSGSGIVGTLCDGSENEIDPSTYIIDNNGVLKIKGRNTETFEEVTFTKKLSDCPKIPRGEISKAFGSLEPDINPVSARKCEFELPKYETVCVGISPSQVQLITDCEGNNLPNVVIDRNNNRIIMEKVSPSENNKLGTVQKLSASINSENCTIIPASKISANLASPIHSASNGFECVLSPEKPLTVKGHSEVPSKEPKPVISITREDKEPPKPKKKETPAIKPPASFHIEMRSGFKEVKTPSVSELLTIAWDKLNENTELAMYEAESLYYELGAVLTTDEQKTAYKKLGSALKVQKTVFTEQREFVTGQRTVTVPIVTEKGEQAGTADVTVDLFELMKEAEERLRK